MRRNLRAWEECLPYVEFACNRPIHYASQYSPFEVIYSFNPITPLDLVPLPISKQVNLDGKKKAEYVRQLHEKVRANIKKRTLQYATQTNKGRKHMVFEFGDRVWFHLRKERFSIQHRNKLLPRGEGPFQVLESVNHKAYKLEFPGECDISPTFNVSDLSPFLAGDAVDLRTNPFQEASIDGVSKTVQVDPSAQVGIVIVLVGPMTRARAKRLNESLQALVRVVQE